MMHRASIRCPGAHNLGQVDGDRGGATQARPDDRIKLLEQEILHPLDIACRNGCPSCSEHAENGANNQIRVAADYPEVFADVAMTDQKGPLWISIMIDQIDTAQRMTDVASVYQWKATAGIGQSPLQLHLPHPATPVRL
jgi:hypothetical protein